MVKVPGPPENQPPPYGRASALGGLTTLAPVTLSRLLTAFTPRRHVPLQAPQAAEPSSSRPWTTSGPLLYNTRMPSLARFPASPFHLPKASQLRQTQNTDMAPPTVESAISRPARFPKRPSKVYKMTQPPPPAF
eukprot:5760766-Prymnesium_polylepis.1